MYNVISDVDNGGDISRLIRIFVISLITAPNDLLSRDLYRCDTGLYAHFIIYILKGYIHFNAAVAKEFLFTIFNRLYYVCIFSSSSR